MKYGKKIGVILLLLGCVALMMVHERMMNQNKIEFHEVVIPINETPDNKVVVATAEELIEAIANEKIQVIEIQNDLGLGYQQVSTSRKDILDCHHEPSMHPILWETGVSKLRIKNKDGLRIYSTNGSRLLHTNLVIESSKNIAIENLKMDELWEWDEASDATYTQNDWDYITIQNAENILIQHCEFGKAYDGITDIKNSRNVTIAYCKVNAVDMTNDSFYRSQFDWLEEHKEQCPMYAYLRDEAYLSQEEIMKLCSYQFKGYLMGLPNSKEKNENIILEYNYFDNIKTRIPLARNSSVCLKEVYVDSSKINYQLLTSEKTQKIKAKYPKLVALSTYGVISLEGSYIEVENCIFYQTKHVYENMRGLSWGQRGKIVTRQEKKVLQNLKEKLEKEAGIQKEWELKISSKQ